MLQQLDVQIALMEQRVYELSLFTYYTYEGKIQMMFVF